MGLRAEADDQRGVRHHEVGGERARGDDVSELLRELGIPGHAIHQVVAVAEGGGDALQPHECSVRVRRQRERRGHHREDMSEDLPEPGGRIHEPVQELVRRFGLPEPEAREQLLGGGAIDARPRRGRAGERLEEGPVEQPLVGAPDEIHHVLPLRSI